MKNLYLLAIISLIPSCATRPVVVTSTQVSATLAGDSNAPPTKVKIGYDRSELVHLPGGSMQHGIVGAFDGEIRNYHGIALTEFLLTGKAACGDLSPGKYPNTPGLPNTDPTPPSRKESLTNGWKAISTNTRTNLGLELVGSDSPGPSLNFGFRRALAAIFPAAQKHDRNSNNRTLPSTLADVSIHGTGLRNSFIPKGVSTNRSLPAGARGTRTVQRIATGRAAELLAREPSTDTQLNKVIRGENNTKPQP